MKFMIYDRGDRQRLFQHHRAFLASLLLGIGDVAGKYYVPKLGRS
jgi:hypothetical protein